MCLTSAGVEDCKRERKKIIAEPCRYSCVILLSLAWRWGKIPRSHIFSSWETHKEILEAKWTQVHLIRNSWKSKEFWNIMRKWFVIGSIIKEWPQQDVKCLPELRKIQLYTFQELNKMSYHCSAIAYRTPSNKVPRYSRKMSGCNGWQTLRAQFPQQMLTISNFKQEASHNDFSSLLLLSVEAHSTLLGVIKEIAATPDGSRPKLTMWMKITSNLRESRHTCRTVNEIRDRGECGSTM